MNKQQKQHIKQQRENRNKQQNQQIKQQRGNMNVCL